MPADQSFLPGEGKWRVDAFLLATWRQGCRSAAPQPRGAVPAVWAGAGWTLLLPSSCVTLCAWLGATPLPWVPNSILFPRHLHPVMIAVRCPMQSGHFYSVILLGAWVSWLKSFFLFFFFFRFWKHNCNCIYICTCVNVCVHTNKLSALWREEVFLFLLRFHTIYGQGASVWTMLIQWDLLLHFSFLRF